MLKLDLTDLVKKTEFSLFLRGLIVRSSIKFEEKSITLGKLSFKGNKCSFLELTGDKGLLVRSVLDLKPFNVEVKDSMDVVISDFLSFQKAIDSLGVATVEFTPKMTVVSGGKGQCFKFRNFDHSLIPPKKPFTESSFLRIRKVKISREELTTLCKISEVVTGEKIQCVTESRDLVQIKLQAGDGRSYDEKFKSEVKVDKSLTSCFDIGYFNEVLKNVSALVQDSFYLHLLVPKKFQEIMLAYFVIQREFFKTEYLLSPIRETTG